MHKSLYVCSCCVTKYEKRIPSPMLDRMDIHIEVPRVNYEKLSSDRLGESSADIRARVESARARQRVRFAEAVNVVSNSDMRVAEVRQPQVQVAVVGAAYHRILKLSRTIADLAGSDAIQSVPLAEELHLWSPEIVARLTIDR
jgi:magnesium chelatase family protein